MRTTFALSSLFVLAAAAACSSGPSAAPYLGDLPANPVGTGVAYAGEAGVDGAATVDGGPTTDGGPATDGAAIDATTNDGAPGGDGGSTSPGSDAQPPVASVCDPAKTWDDPKSVPGLPELANELPFAISADERTAAWLTDAGSGLGTLTVADRDDATASFGAPVAVPITGGAAALYFSRAGGIGLSADGLSVIGVRADGRGLGMAMRFARGGAWVPVAIEGSFAAIATALNPGETIVDVVVATDGTALVYSRIGKDPSTTVYESRRTTGDWPNGSAHSEASLAAGGGGRKRPTFLSADHLSLFAWDEGAARSTLYFRALPSGPFSAVADLGAVRGATANAACTRLYALAPSAGGFRAQSRDRR